MPIQGMIHCPPDFGLFPEDGAYDWVLHVTEPEANFRLQPLVPDDLPVGAIIKVEIETILSGEVGSPYAMRIADLAPKNVVRCDLSIIPTAAIAGYGGNGTQATLSSHPSPLSNYYGGGGGGAGSPGGAGGVDLDGNPSGPNAGNPGTLEAGGLPGPQVGSPTSPAIGTPEEATDGGGGLWVDTPNVQVLNYGRVQGGGGGGGAGSRGGDPGQAGLRVFGGPDAGLGGLAIAYTPGNEPVVSNGGIIGGAIAEVPS